MRTMRIIKREGKGNQRVIDFKGIVAAHTVGIGLNTGAVYRWLSRAAQRAPLKCEQALTGLALFDQPLDKLGAVADIQFLKDLGNMGAHRREFDAQFARDGLVGESLANILGEVTLSFGQARQDRNFIPSLLGPSRVQLGPLQGLSEGGLDKCQQLPGSVTEILFSRAAPDADVADIAGAVVGKHVDAEPKPVPCQEVIKEFGALQILDGHDLGD